MNRTTWLQDLRMLKFRDVLSRWERRELSIIEAGELLGMSERQFRRYRDRYEEEGDAGLIDRGGDPGNNPGGSVRSPFALPAGGKPSQGRRRQTDALAWLALTSSAMTLSSAVVPFIADRPCSLKSIHPSLKPSSIRIRGNGFRVP